MVDITLLREIESIEMALVVKRISFKIGSPSLFPKHWEFRVCYSTENQHIVLLLNKKIKDFFSLHITRNAFFTLQLYDIIAGIAGYYQSKRGRFDDSLFGFPLR